MSLRKPSLPAKVLTPTLSVPLCPATQDPNRTSSVHASMVHRLSVARLVGSSRQIMCLWRTYHVYFGSGTSAYCLLRISTSTSKQSRYRPSGDRQPVACGYKDPITQIQCDEPFNRSVELRRHVRAVHVPAEALAVTMGQLSRSQATLLPADWKPGDGDVLRPKCLCGKEFSRLDALRRHWTGVQAEVKDGKCISCPSSLGKKK